MKKQILFFDAIQHKKRMDELHAAKKSMQELLSHFNSLDPPIMIHSISELERLANEGENYIRERMANEVEKDIPKFGIFKVDKEKAAALLELPDLNELNGLVNSLSYDIKKDINILSTDGKTVKLEEKAIEAIKNQCTLFADTKPKANLLQAYKDAVSSLNKLQEALIQTTGERVISEYTKVSDLVKVNEEGIKENTWLFERLRGQIYKHEHRQD